MARADETMEIPAFEYEETSEPNPLEELILSPVTSALRGTFGILGSAVKATGDGIRKSFSATSDGLRRTLSGFDKEAVAARRAEEERQKTARRQAEAATRLQAVRRGSQARLLAAQMAASRAALTSSPAAWFVFVLHALGCGHQPA